MNPDLLTEAQRLIGQLERLSADSHWAHRASGLRGSLLRAMQQSESHIPADRDETTRLESELNRLIQAGSTILYRAAKEIRTAELWGYSGTGK